MQDLIYFSLSPEAPGGRTTILVVITDRGLIPQTEDWLEEILFSERKVEFVDLPFEAKSIESTLRAGKAVISRTYRDEQPLEENERFFLKAANLPGTFVCFGECPRIPESLKPFIQVLCYLWPSLGRAIDNLQKKFGSLTLQQRFIVEEQIEPLLRSFDYSQFIEIVQRSENFDEFIEKVQDGGDLPPPVLTIGEAWFDESRLETNELMVWADLLRGATSISLGKGKSALVGGLKGSVSKPRRAVEGACFLVNNRQSGIIIELDFSIIESGQRLGWAKLTQYWRRKALDNIHYRSEGYAVVFVKGVGEFVQAREIYRLLAQQERIAAIFFEVLGDSSGWQIPVFDLERDENEVRREPDPVREMHEKNQRLKKGDSMFRKIFGDIDAYRFGLRCFYGTIFFLDICSDLSGVPRKPDLFGTGIWFFSGIILATIEWPAMSLFVPFCAMWWNKRPNATHPRARPMRSWTVWGFVSFLLLSGGVVLAILYTRNFGYSADGVQSLFPKEEADSRLFSYAFAILINVFEVVGLLVDRYWIEFNEFKDIFGDDVLQNKINISPTDQKPKVVRSDVERVATDVAAPHSTASSNGNCHWEFRGGALCSKRAIAGEEFCREHIHQRPVAT